MHSSHPHRRALRVIGLTGPVAAGKSCVARQMSDSGVVIVDADALGHRALDTPSVRTRVAQEFGGGVLRSDGTLDRGALAALAFGDRDARARLERIVHPVVGEWIEAELAQAAAAGARAAVIDCALLFESGLDRTCDLTVCVDAPEAQRLARAKASRGWDDVEFRRREAAQLPASEKRARADRVLVNDAEPEVLRERVDALLAEVLPRARAAQGTPGRDES